MKKTTPKKLDLSTEEKIKRAAEKIFMEKGFSGARTRDIAEEAGMNLALLNYYFRSKENLFEVIMMEKLKVFFDVIIDILKNADMSLTEKLPLLVNKYTDLLTAQPDLPIFLLSELKQNPDFFAERLKIKEKLNNEVFKAIEKETHAQKKEDMVQLLVTFLGMTLFPFIVREVIQNMFDIPQKTYNEMLNERRELIPVWINEIIKSYLK